MIPLSVSAVIDIDDVETVYIDVIEVSKNNYRASLYSDTGTETYDVEIFNFEGPKLGLVGKVIDGWAMRRKN